MPELEFPERELREGEEWEERDWRNSGTDGIAGEREWGRLGVAGE